MSFQVCQHFNTMCWMIVMRILSTNQCLTQRDAWISGKIYQVPDAEVHCTEIQGATHRLICTVIQRSSMQVHTETPYKVQHGQNFNFMNAESDTHAAQPRGVLEWADAVVHTHSWACWRSLRLRRPGPPGGCTGSSLMPSSGEGGRWRMADYLSPCITGHTASKRNTISAWRLIQSSAWNKGQF